MAMISPAYDYSANMESLHTGIEFRSPPAIVETVDPAFFAYRGSGSQNWHEFFSNISGVSIEKDIPEAHPVSIESVQKTITEIFGISLDVLAKYCGTTRRSLYNWRSDISPRDKAAKKLFMLYRVAQDWRDAGAENPGPNIHEKVLGGKSLDDLLSAEELDIDAIAFIRTRLELASLGEEPITDPFEG